MGKHVVYVRAREEAELEAAGLDVGDWVRERIREALDLRRKTPLPGVTAAAAETLTRVAKGDERDLL